MPPLETKITTIESNQCDTLSRRRIKSSSSMEPYRNQISTIQTLSYGIEPTIWYFHRSIKPYLHTLLRATFVSILNSISRKIFVNNLLKVTISILLTYYVIYVQSNKVMGPFHNISLIWKLFGTNLNIFVPPILILTLSPAPVTLRKQFTHTNTWNMFHAFSSVWMIITITLVPR